jgi:non-specific protein-tyrosine kinase
MSPAAEGYRRLRLNLTSAGGAQLRTLVVAAAGFDPEKSEVVANLAVSFARVGKRTILVDCDLRRPEVHVLFGLDNQAGLTSALADPGIKIPLRETKVNGLQVLTSGPLVSVPSDLIASPAMVGLLAGLHDQADIVLFDVPPVVLATDAAELAPQVDGVLLTISAGRTKREDAQRARDMLSKVNARLVGAALINAPVDAELRKYLAAA